MQKKEKIAKYLDLNFSYNSFVKYPLSSQF